MCIFFFSVRYLITDYRRVEDVCLPACCTWKLIYDMVMCWDKWLDWWYWNWKLHHFQLVGYNNIMLASEGPATEAMFRDNINGYSNQVLFTILFCRHSIKDDYFIFSQAPRQRSCWNMKDEHFLLLMKGFTISHFFYAHTSLTLNNTISYNRHVASGILKSTTHFNCWMWDSW